MNDVVDISSYCKVMVREQDHDRYLTLYIAPEASKDALFAILAFNQEVAKTRESVSEPTMGAIRLQWWREALEGIEAGTPRSHPVVEALSKAHMASPLPLSDLVTIIDAREMDVYDSAPEKLSDLIAYARGTAGVLNRVTLQVLDSMVDQRHAQAAEDIGTAWGLLGIVRAIAFHASAQRHMMPDDMLTQAGITPDSLYRGEFTPDVFKVVEGIVTEAETLLDSLKDTDLCTSGNRSTAFILTRFARRVIKDLKRVRYDVTKLDPTSGKLGKFYDVFIGSMFPKL